MKNRLTALIMAIPLILSTFLSAQEITFTTKLKNNDAYLAMYLTDFEGDYQQTLWVSGSKKKNYSQLRGWAQASGLKSSEYDGKTGATALSEQSQIITLNVQDSLLDSELQIHIDGVGEAQRPTRDEIVVDLNKEGVGKLTSGSTYVESFSYTF